MVWVLSGCLEDQRQHREPRKARAWTAHRPVPITCWRETLVFHLPEVWVLIGNGDLIHSLS